MQYLAISIKLIKLFWFFTFVSRFFTVLIQEISCTKIQQYQKMLIRKFVKKVSSFDVERLSYERVDHLKEANKISQQPNISIILV